MVTLKHVAEKAGVSTATVSRVISGKQVVAAEVKSRVERIIEDTGYRPNQNARALAQNHSNLLALVTPDLSQSFFGALASGVIEEAEQLGLHVSISSPAKNEASSLEAIRAVRRQGYKHVLVDNSWSNSEQSLVQLSEEVPGLVVLNRFIPSIASRCVCVDNAMGGMIAANHMIEQGHSRIAFITSNSHIQDPLDRLYGAKQAFNQQGVAFIDALSVSAEPSLEGGKAAAIQLLNSNETFTAVVAYNDNMAIGAMNEFLDQGIAVPNDVSVIGFDDLFFATTCRPALTTLHYPIREMAAYAVKLSLSLGNKELPETNQLHRFIPSLVTRSSVKPLGDL